MVKQKETSNKFSDIIGLIMQPLTSFFTEAIKGKVIDIKKSTFDALYKFKVQVFRSAVEGFLLLAGLAALIVGAIMFLSRYLSTDVLLMAFGLLVVVFVLLSAKLKR